MRRNMKTLGLAAVGALLLLAAIAGLAEKGDAAPQAVPTNQSPPVISGTAEEGKTLTTTNGNWSGAPTSFTYAWRRCDASGGSCANISGTNQNTYVLKKVDVDNTMRVRVIARNSDGASSPSDSVPTAVVRAAPAPPSGCDGAAPIPIANVSLPNRLLIDGQSISPTVVLRSTKTITIRFRVTCKSKPVQGALLYADVVPFNQYSTPAEQPTGADGWGTLTMNQQVFPAATRQQLLVVFGRARKGGEDPLGGVSTRRLVSFPVDLRR